MANAASPSSTDRVAGADATEILRITGEVQADAPPPPPTPDPTLPNVGAERPHVEVHDGPAPGEKEDRGEEVIDDLDHLARSDPKRIEAMLKDLEEEELVDVVMLAFSWPDGKEITEKRARRIAHYLHRVIQRHAQSLQWLLENIPETMLGVLVAYELWVRLKKPRAPEVANA